ncbi:MAG: NAD-dependent epimerase/dehydratase family protein, partial [Planctomycetota bacterium]|nr:NAD-dependent epimerase/dehydratase family protein [Planctomycetota bacterium]
MLDWSSAKTVVTGGAGFLGQVVCDVLARRGCEQVVVPLHADYDLTREADVARMYRDCAPDVVIHLAAEVGGIGANMRHPGRFFFANMAMGLHLIEHARQVGLKKFVQVGTVCAYPKFAPVPFREDDVWNGYPEETNAPYGVAKKALFVMLDAYHTEYGLPGAVVIPVNLFGPRDDFEPATSHVIPALIRRFVGARERGENSVTCWGTGAASREFLYVDDAAEGVVRAAETMDEPLPINLGTGREIRIKDLA